MKKLLLTSILLLLMSAYAATAQQLKHPAAFVPADSVFFWARDISNLRLPALATDSTLRPQRLHIGKTEKKNFKKSLQEWERRAEKEMNLVGGAGDEATEPQALPAAATLYNSAALWLMTADGRYAEAMERVLFNALPAALLSEYPLERQVAAQALTNGAGMAFATDREGVFVNFYTNSLARIKTKELGMTLDVQTSMPYEPQVKIRIGGLKQNATFKLRLRLPLWASGQAFPGNRYVVAGPPQPKPAVFLNGRKEDFAVVNGYWEISRTWRNGDEVYFVLPFAPQFVRHGAEGKALRGKVALQRGPLIYAPATATQGCHIETTTPLTIDYSGKHTTSACIAGTLFKVDGTPADAAAPAVPFFAVPYAEKARPVWLDEAK